MRRILPDPNKQLLTKDATILEWQELLISLMRECSAKHDTINYNLFNDFCPGRKLARTCERVFGSWNNAMKLAGFPINRKWKINKTYIANCIKSLYKKYGYLTYTMFEHNIKECGVSVTSIERHFGSFNQALKELGIPTRKASGYFSEPKEAKDKHLCDSIAESIIDDWLFEHDIPHQIHVEYPRDNEFNTGFNNIMKCDFYIQHSNTYIEFFGMSNIKSKKQRYRSILKRYRDTMTRKMALCNKHSLTLLLIYPDDLKNLDNCLKKLITPSI